MEKTSKAGGFIRLPGGLHVPATAVPPPRDIRREPIFPKLGKKQPAGVLGIRTRKLLKVGSKEVEIRGSTAEAPSIHKLEPEARKERRADNKAMKRSRQLHRRRRKHGR